jgi:hypothetical protein
MLREAGQDDASGAAAGQFPIRRLLGQVEVFGWTVFRFPQLDFWPACADSHQSELRSALKWIPSECAVIPEV